VTNRRPPKDRAAQLLEQQRRMQAESPPVRDITDVDRLTAEATERPIPSQEPAPSSESQAPVEAGAGKISTRIDAAALKRLKVAAAVRRADRLEPRSIGAIVEAAVLEWLDRNGH
jgi:hypothetical protein